MTEAKSRSVVWRALTTPMGPRILPRLPGFSRVVYPARVIAESGLPREAAGLVSTVVARTRLWRSEQVDVARELCAHFADGLAAGRSEAELVRDFGDPAEAAILIRKAKQRQRSIVWQAWARVRRVAAVVGVVALVVYAGLVVRYFTGSPLILHNYSAEIAEPGFRVAEGDRAWPLYELALSKLGAYTPAERTWNWGVLMPGDAQWPKVEELLAVSDEALELSRQGAARPALGLDIRRQVGESDPGQVLGALDFEFSGKLIRLARLLREDAVAAVARGEGDRVRKDLVAIIGIAGHCHEPRISFVGSTAFHILYVGVSGLGQILAAYPAVIPDEGLGELAHRIGAFGGGGTLRIDLSGDRLIVLDRVQRSYTDDGHGDGRMTGAGRRMLASYTGGQRWPIVAATDPRRLGRPVALAAAPGRHELIEIYDRAMSAAAEAGAGAMYSWTLDPDERAEEVLSKDAWSFPALNALMPQMGGTYGYAEAITQRRDAALAEIALELYRREFGDYPATLGQLTPRYMPAVPIDRFDGKQLKYKLETGRPLVYSTGNDRADNGGVLGVGQNANRRAMIWRPPGREVHQASQREPSAVGTDWILWPPVEYTVDGDLIDRFTPRPARSGAAPK